MTRLLGTLATLAMLGALAGCGGDDSGTGADAGRDPAGGTTSGSPDDTSSDDTSDDPSDDTAPDADAGGSAEPCPAQLATGSGPLPSRPAAQAPDLSAPAGGTSAWVCRYQPGEVPDGPAWDLDGEAVEVDGADVPDLTGLEPAPADQFCSQEIGPRWLLVLPGDEGTVGVVVDDFGCGDVTLTDDPASTVPGAADQDGVVGGVLTGPPGLARRLAALHGA